MTLARIVIFTRSDRSVIDEVAALLHATFLNRTTDWQDIESATAEVLASLESDRVSKVALDADGRVVGWIGAISSYDGRVWELHPLVVAEVHRRCGIGRALVEDLERVLEARGAFTLWLGSDDENEETTAAGADLYADVLGAIRDLRRVRGDHPLEFYRRLGFRVTGVLPDANGPGKPDIFLAKRLAGVA